jgi:hypothetical protein
MASYCKYTVYRFQRISVCRTQGVFLLGNPKVKTSREFIPHENNMYLEILADNKVYISIH